MAVHVRKGRAYEARPFLVLSIRPHGNLSPMPGLTIAGRQAGFRAVGYVKDSLEIFQGPGSRISDRFTPPIPFPDTREINRASLPLRRKTAGFSPFRAPAKPLYPVIRRLQKPAVPETMAVTFIASTISRMVSAS